MRAFGFFFIAFLGLTAAASLSLAGEFRYTETSSGSVKGFLAYHSDAFDSTDFALARFFFKKDGETEFLLRFTAREQLDRDPDVSWRLEDRDGAAAIPIYQPTIDTTQCAPGWETGDYCRIRCAENPVMFEMSETVSCDTRISSEPLWLEFKVTFTPQQLSKAVAQRDRLIGIEFSAGPDYGRWYISDPELAEKLCRYGLPQSDPCKGGSSAGETAAATPDPELEKELDVCANGDLSFREFTARADDETWRAYSTPVGNAGFSFGGDVASDFRPSMYLQITGNEDIRSLINYYWVVIETDRRTVRFPTNHEYRDVTPDGSYRSIPQSEFMLRGYDEDFFGDFLAELDRAGYATVKLRVDEDGPELAEYEFYFRGIDTMIEVAKAEGMNQTRRKIDGVCRSIDTTRQNRLNDDYSDDDCDWFDEWC